MTINLLPRKTWRQRILKGVHVFALLALVANMSMASVFISPTTTLAKQADTAEQVPQSATVNTDAATTAAVSTPVPNPALGQSCGLDIGLIVDTSGSIDSTEMLQMKTAMTNFSNAFVGTPTVFSLTSFADDSVLKRAFSRTPTQMAGDIGTDIPSYGNGWTNWDSGLARSFATFDPRAAKSNLIVIATDGSPNHWGYPTNTGITDYTQALSYAVTRANTIKTAGTRIVVVGIGNDTSDPATLAEKLQKMEDISGTNVATTPGAITTSTDVIKVTDFTGIGSALSAFASQLCGGKILVQKQFDTNGDGQVDLDGSQPNDALTGWTFDVNGTPTNPAPLTTTNTGALSFDVQNGTYSVSETNIKSGTRLASATCVKGTQAVGTFDPATKTVNGLVMGTDGTINCNFVNSTDTGTLKVVKHVVGGTATAANWQLHVKQNGSEVAGSPQAGSEAGTSYTLPVGTYNVSETGGSANYTQSFSDNCPGGTITIANGQTAACTLTNTRDTARVVFQKVLVGNSQNQVPADWTFTVNDQQVNGNGGSTVLQTNQDYTVTESSSYSNLYSLTNATGACHLNAQGQIIVNTAANGGTCTVTNTRNTGSLVVHKDVVNPDGGAVSDTHQFTVTLDGGNSKTIAEGTDATYLNLPTGTYTVAENSDADYTFVSYSSDTDVNTAGAQVVVTKDGTTQLTVTNKQKKATVTINKDVRDYLGNDVSDSTSFQVTWSGSPMTISEGSPAVFQVNPGTYTFTETANSLYTTQTASYQVTVTSNGSASRTFVNWQKSGTITGMKFNDMNGNGVKDSGDNGLQNWEIYIDSNGNGSWDSAEPKVVTDVNGNYTFTNLTPGTYKVREIQKNGWTQTYPSNNLNNVTLSVGQTVSNQNFGNFQLGAITGMKFNDLNGNGVKDAGEPGIAGWTINITSPVNTNTTTDVNGNYIFPNLTAGTYAVSETHQTGWTQTAPAGGTYSVPITSGTAAADKNFGNFQNISVRVCKYVDTNGDGNIANDPLYTGQGGWAMTLNTATTQNTVEGCTTFSNLGPGAYTLSEGAKSGWVKTYPVGANYQFNAVSGQNQDYKFGNFQTATVSGYKYNDMNGDGNLADGAPLQNWEIKATKGAAVKTATTDVNGFYQFSFSPSENGQWIISETLKADWTQTAPNGGTYTVNVASGTNEVNKNFGNFHNASVTVCKYVDVNGDGNIVGDPLYTAAGGWPVRFHGITQNTVDGCTTFTGITPGSYTVDELNLSGWTRTMPTGPSYTYTAVSGDHTTYNFANFQLGSISGMKFNDLNGNGTKDIGEPGLAGWTISISGPASANTVTDANGNYSFANLTAGTYTVSETQQGGWTQTAPAGNTYSVAITSGTAATGKNFGNFQKISVRVCKYVDVNGDGNIANDPLYTGQGGWAMTLNTATTQNTVEGCTTFSNLGPGAYTVSEGAKTGWIKTYPTAANYAFNAVSGQNQTFAFGNYQTATVSGYKFEDTNGNGVRDNGELGLPNWHITATKGASVKDVTTDANGFYQFSFAPNETGSWTVGEVNQAGWTQTAPVSATYAVAVNSGTAEINKNFGNFKNFNVYVCKYVDGNGDGSVAYDSFYNGEGGWPIVLNDVTHYTTNGCAEFTDLGPGSYTLNEGSKVGWIQTNPQGGYEFNGASGFDPEYIFANFQLGSVSGHKFEDMNGNGKFDLGTDLPKSDVTIKLWHDGEVVATDVTDENGAYSFTGLKAGDYTVSENPLAGWIQTYPALPGTYAFTISSGTVLTDYDFGNFKQTSISGMKFNDVNGNGVKDQGENGLAGWTIKLFALNDGQYVSQSQTVTDDAGNYSFNALTPGTYSLSETNQDGWTQTYPAAPGSYTGIELTSGIPFVGKDFGNFKLGKISGYKFDNTGSKLDNWQVCLSGGSIDNGVDKDFGSHCVVTGSGEWPTGYYEFSGLLAGTYSVKETAQDGWTAVTPASGEYTGIAVTSQFDKSYDFTNRRIYPDLTISKTDGLTTANPGQTITYTIVVKNQGEYKADGVVVTDTLPAHLTFVSASPAAATQVGNALTWNLGTLAVGASQTITVTAKIDALMPFGNTDLKNTATASTTTVEPDTSNNTATDTTTVPASPTISLTKTASAPQVNPGDTITFTMTWGVDSNSQATNVVLTDPVPANTTFVSANNGGVYNSGTNTVTWTLGTKNPGDTGAVQLVVKAFTPLASGTVIKNVATLGSTQNNPVQAQASVTIVSGPILKISKVADKQQVNPGSKVTYTVVITNTGNDQATNATLTDTLPAGFTFADSGLSTKTFVLGNLLAGTSVTTTYDVNVASDATAGIHENTATTKADNHPAVTAKAPVEVIIPQILAEQAFPKLVITKKVDKAFANPGNTVTYTVVVENTGNAVAINVQVQDLLPAGFTFTDKTTTKVFKVGDLAPGQKHDVKYDVVISKDMPAGTYKNFAVAWADNHPNVTVSAPLEVRVPKVLGAEILPTTGNNLLEIVFIAFAALFVFFIGWGLWVTRRDENEERA